jgi:hypothetical protein
MGDDAAVPLSRRAGPEAEDGVDLIADVVAGEGARWWGKAEDVPADRCG